MSQPIKPWALKCCGCNSVELDRIVDVVLRHKVPIRPKRKKRKKAKK